MPSPKRTLSTVATQGLGYESSLVAQIRNLLASCDLTRRVVVYIRQSDDDGKGTHGGYKMSQEQMKGLLIDAGVSESMIDVYDDDSNKSGALGIKWRLALQTINESCARGQVGLIVCLAIDRLYRNPKMVEPAEFAEVLGANNVCVLTTCQEALCVLTMSSEDARAKFRDEAQKGAEERARFRSRSMAGREQYVNCGAASSMPTPFGWKKNPRVPAHVSPTGKYQPPRYEIYDYHADIKLKIMRVADLDTITSYRSLRMALIAEGLLPLPPFEPHLAVENLSKSVYWRSWVDDEESHKPRRKPRIDDEIMPGEKMLQGILLEPLALGDRWYGSGRTGHYKMNEERSRIDPNRQTLDAKIMEWKVLVCSSPELAICNTPDLEALFWRVHDKWSHIDYRAAREHGTIDYSEHGHIPVNALRKAAVKQPGRPRDSKNGLVNYWGGKVFCGKHGGVERSHPLLHLVTGKGWGCVKDKDKGLTDKMCCYWGSDNRLLKCLDWYLISQLRQHLREDVSFIGKSSDHAITSKAEISDLETQRQRLLEQIDYQKFRLAADQETWYTSDKDNFKTLTAERHQNEILPKQLQVARLEEQTSKLQQQLLEMNVDETDEALRNRLEKILDTRDGIPPAKMRELILTFVDYVMVYIGDGIVANEVVIDFHWKGVRKDVLISWTGSSRDTRPFTEAEDEALRQLWPIESGASYEEIKQHLLPGRKFSKITSRITELQIRGIRPQE
jgi:hypothetical protein